VSDDKPNKPTRAALRRELRRLARNFADDIVDLLDRHGVWDDVKAERPATTESPRVRRSPDALAKVKSRIVSELRTRSEPVSIGSIAATLGLTSRQITHPMSLLVDEGLVLRTGIRRGARYRLAPQKRGRSKKKKTKKKKKAARRS
jgi:DNA-binding transcriptional ArsR family regulator